MRRLLLIILLITIVLTGVFYQQNKNFFQFRTQRHLVVYSTLPEKILMAWGKSFGLSHKDFPEIYFVNDLNGEEIQADIALTDSYNLKNLQKGGSLKKWQSLFYNTYVFLINYNAGKKYGQKALASWNDLLNKSNLRIVLENFDNSPIQRQILSSMATKWGEDSCIDYFRRLDQYIIQYTKHPFSPLRMILSDDADVAIVTKDYAVHNLGKDYNGYLCLPQDGSVAIIYGAGIFQGTDSYQEAEEFINWLSKSTEAKIIILQQHRGWEFFDSKDDMCSNLKIQNLWTDSHYDENKQYELINRWYSESHFAND